MEKVELLLRMKNDEGKIIELIEDKNFRKQLGDEAFKTSKNIV